MPFDLRFRTMRLIEAPRLAAFYKHHLPTDNKFAPFRREVTTQSLCLGWLVGSKLYYIVQDRTIIAAGMVWNRWLGNVCVAPKSQGNGVGSALISSILDIHPNLSLFCTEEMISFYQRGGFVISKTIMRRRLNR